MQDSPLDGVRVIDYSHFLAGPYVGRCLAALGADVIKVERPGTGDAGRQHATVSMSGKGGAIQLNMGKRGLSVNVRSARARPDAQVVRDSADVLVENYRRRPRPRRPRLCRVVGHNPGLVYLSISAYGHAGRTPTAPASGGSPKPTSWRWSGRPANLPAARISLGDMYTGSHAVAAITAALLGQVRSGRGQHIDLALYDTLFSMHEYAVQNWTIGGVLPEPNRS